MLAASFADLQHRNFGLDTAGTRVYCLLILFSRTIGTVAARAMGDVRAVRLLQQVVVDRAESRLRYGWGVLSFLLRLAAQDFVDSMHEVIDIEGLANESNFFGDRHVA